MCSEEPGFSPALANYCSLVIPSGAVGFARGSDGAVEGSLPDLPIRDAERNFSPEVSVEKTQIPRYARNDKPEKCHSFVPTCGCSGSVGFFVPALAITHRHPNPQRHKTGGRNEQHNDGAINSPLPILAGGRSGRIAHGATLAKGRPGPQHQ